jgi:serine protease Do
MDSRDTRSRFSPRAVALAGAFAIAAAGAWFGTSVLSPARADTRPQAPGSGLQARADEPAAAAPGGTAPSTPSAAPAVAVRGAPDFTAIVRQYGPAVVNVSTVATRTADDGAEGAMPFPFGFGHPQVPQRQLVKGIGSGFIVKADGLILTNAHVVDGAREVKVKLTDKREFRAKVLGEDKDTDVAVLKIDAKGLPTVQIGDPSRVQVGEWVLAIGSPFGFENSATAGVVSARARSLPGAGYVPFIQTDVAVNPGNSGGPLFDLAGRVVGINSQIYSGSGGYMGISFAIPIDVAMNVGQQLAAHGRVTRGQLGVVVQDVNQSLARSFGLPRPAGALVASVQKGGAAAAAGVKPGDVILAVDGQEVGDSVDLPPRVAAMKPGTTTKLTVWRDGARHDLSVKVGQAQDKTVASAQEGPQHGRLGLAVRPLTPEEQRQAGVEGGALVEQAAGPAAQAGIQPGDVVVAVDGKLVKDVADLRSAVEKAKGKDGVALLVQRGDVRLFVPVELG